MDLLGIGAQLLNDRLGLSVDPDTIKSALTGLLGDGKGGIDVAALAGKMASSGDLGGILNSWLGDGGNTAISADSILNLLGRGEVSEFASKVGTDADSAAAGLSDVLPQLMDKASSGGSLLDAVGGASGLLGAATSFFSK